MTVEQPAAMPEKVAQAARVRLTEWLTAQAPRPELGATLQELTDWTAHQAEEYVVLVPPGYANLLFLVADHGISSFAPSEQTLEQAMVAARPRTELT